MSFMAGEVIREDYLRILKRYKDVDLIKVITGMRRTGKSTLMRQYISHLVHDGIPRSNIIYIDMDSMQNFKLRDGMLFYSFVISKKEKGRLYLLIDEVQNIEGWERILESLRNDIDCDIYITGSNAYMLSSEISTLLTGRSVTIAIMPLSLKEMCILHDEKDPKLAFLKYMRHGGLPIFRSEYSDEMIFQITNELKSDIIIKDICNRKPGTDPIKIRKVIDYLYSEVGNPISVTRMSNIIKISATTISEYIQLITDSMLFIKVERYNLKGHNVLSQEPKYYCTDTGMRYSQPIASERDFGKTLENIVFLELIRRGYRVYVGRTGLNDDKSDAHLEIDFIVMKKDTLDYYQVTESLNDPSVREREFRPLRSITGRGERYVLTFDDIPVNRSRDAITMNIVDFLMEEAGGRSSTEEESYEFAYMMLSDYIDVCRNISNTVLTRDNFDELSTNLQSRFFNLQSYFRKPELIGDEFIQEQLSKIRANNVRIFNAMVACVNANREPKYKPVMYEQMEELSQIYDNISRHSVHSVY